MKALLCILIFGCLSEYTFAQCNYNDSLDFSEANLTTCELINEQTIFSGELFVRGDIQDVIEFVPPAGMEVYEIYASATEGQFDLYVPVLFEISNSKDDHVLDEDSPFKRIRYQPAITEVLQVTFTVPACADLSCRGIHTDWELRVKMRERPVVVNLDSPDLPSYCSTISHSMNVERIRYDGVLSDSDYRDQWILLVAQELVIDSIILEINNKVHSGDEVNVYINSYEMGMPLSVNEEIVWNLYSINETCLDLTVESNYSLAYGLVIYGHNVQVGLCGPQEYEDTFCLNTIDSYIYSGIGSHSGSLFKLSRGVGVYNLSFTGAGSGDELEGRFITNFGGFETWYHIGEGSFTVVPNIPFNPSEIFIKVEAYSHQGTAFWEYEVSTGNPNLDYWKGSINSQWDEENNWDRLQPSSSSNIIIGANSAFSPSIDNCERISELLVEAGAQLDVNGGLIVSPK